MNRTLANLALMAAMSIVVVSCGRSSPPEADELKAAATPAENAEPIMLHARLEYSGGHTVRDVGQSGTTLTMLIVEPTLRVGRGPTAVFSVDNSRQTQIQGFVHGSGRALIASRDGSIEEHYDKAGSWPALRTSNSGSYLITMPEPSDIGDGQTITVEVHMPVVGDVWTQNGGQKYPDVTFARPLECTERDEHLDDKGPACFIKFSIDPTPSGPKSDAGKIVYGKMVEALKQPNGEALLAMLGQVFGAETTYDGGGDFVTHVSKTYVVDKDDSKFESSVDITIWSSRRGIDAPPKNVTPVKAL